jgi:hypothetical protein
MELSLWFALVLLLPLWLLQNIVHEVSHTLIPRWKGCKTSIYPWPSIRDGRFYFAYATWTCRMSKREKAWTSAMPRVANLALLVLSTMLLAIGMPKLLATALLVLQVTNWVDFSYSTMGIFRDNPANDAWQTAKYFGWSESWLRRGSVAAMVGTLALAALPHLF